jgi:glycosyltransferase involved in cell wall biosynthesis
VLILDDASPDNTKHVGEQLAREHSCVEYRRHATNKGHITTYNEGLQWATGDYTSLLSADDLLTPGALKRAAAVLDAHPQVALVYGQDIKTAAPMPEQYVRVEPVSVRLMSGPEFVATCCRECYNIVPTPTVVVRTNIQQAIGGYRTDLPHAGDIEMWLRFAAHGSVAALECQQAYYRVHAENMSARYCGVADLVQLRAAFLTFFAANGHRLGGCRALHELVRRNLASEFYWLAQGLFDQGDVAACEECIGLALETYPAFRYRPEWARFQCKRLMGVALWSQLRPALRRVRRSMRSLVA